MRPPGGHWSLRWNPARVKLNADKQNANGELEPYNKIAQFEG